MKYTIAAVGKLKRGFYQDACAHYLKRLNPYGTTRVVEVAVGKQAQTRQQDESKALLTASSAEYQIALDERGKTLTSVQLANAITQLENRAISHVCLFIGGADGHSDDLRSTCDALWRLSDLTLPHELARVVLLEQLYRAETIRAGHPYHREG
ncbi:MAG: 23S rRNA (pseudouridine(1915)-N(3))-methyltransferase RlmH [Deinococcota bacterium]